MPGRLTRLFIRAAPLAGSACLAACLAACAAPAGDTGPVRTWDLTQEAASDPDSPRVLEASLAQADSLLQTDAGDCHIRLESARTALERVLASPALGVLLPLGQARAASLEYELHRARAQCPASGPGSEKGAAAGGEGELRAALEAAQRSVALYRFALDYPSMAVMQFNVAVAQRQLGDRAASVAQLAAAVDMDHEYGLPQEARDGEALLALWRGQPAAQPGNPGQSALDQSALDQSAQEPSPPEAVPAHAVTLQFAWVPGVADLHVDVSTRHLVDGRVVSAQGFQAFKRQVRAVRDGWRVSYERGINLVPDGGEFPDSGAMRGVFLPLTQGLFQWPQTEVDAQGRFRKVIDADHFSAWLGGCALGLMHVTSLQRLPLSLPQLQELQQVLSPWSVAAQALEEQDFETGAWAGVTLEQGVWYTMVADLTAPGLRQAGLRHDVQFAYTRDVPCTSGPAAAACVEIVVQATPQSAAVADLVTALGGPGRTPRYWSSTYVRLVTEAASLTPHVLDVRRYWHFADRTPRSGRESGSEQTVTLFSYPAARSGQTSSGADSN